MKKTFVNPEMNISLFEMENVVTDSLSTATNAENAETALKAADATDITKINWTF